VSVTGGAICRQSCDVTRFMHLDWIYQIIPKIKNFFRPARTKITQKFFHHRLNGSPSPALTATCLSYGSLCDFIFPQPTWRSHPSTDFDAKWLKRRGFTHTCACWSKNRNFLKPLTPRTPKPSKFAQFWSGQLFSLDFVFNIGGLTKKHPLFFIGAQ